MRFALGVRTNMIGPSISVRLKKVEHPLTRHELAATQAQAVTNGPAAQDPKEAGSEVLGLSNSVQGEPGDACDRPGRVEQTSNA